MEASARRIPVANSEERRTAILAARNYRDSKLNQAGRNISGFRSIAQVHYNAGVMDAYYTTATMSHGLSN